ncbi:carboxylate-amine ligase [Catenulispora subtropica]|uniref:Putative glutamate--cysteine ligase 2 n=1 Tax=Catenulispora subtropica TaxID=450798 RepID=A0ABN2T923_9ACTN
MARTSPHRFETLTLGVEEEFVLTDPASRSTVPLGPDVCKRAADRLGERVARELYASQIEAHTRPARRAAELRRDLVEDRLVLAEAATRSDCLLVASGSAVLTSKPFPISEGARYERMWRRYSGAAAHIDSEPSGCHIHLGDLDRGEAMALAGHLRPWLPVLQALATNSPFAAGEFRNCASWRHYQQQAWPTVGPAPLITGETYETLADDLVLSGVLMDRKMIYWYARPSEHLPTLEIRVPDVNADVDTALLVAVLTRALATVFLPEARRGEPGPRLGEADVREAHRQAAVHGLAGRWTHPFTRRAMPLSAALRALVEQALPALEALGEARLTGTLLRRLTRSGTGDRRQREIYRRRRRLTDVVDDLAARTMLA